MGTFNEVGCYSAVTVAGQYRNRSARAFERVMRMTGLPVTEQQTALAAELGLSAPIHRRTLIEWKRGKRRVTLEAYLAACKLAKADPGEVMHLVDTTCGFEIRLAGQYLYCDQAPGHEDLGIPHRAAVEVPVTASARAGRVVIRPPARSRRAG